MYLTIVGTFCRLTLLSAYYSKLFILYLIRSTFWLLCKPHTWQKILPAMTLNHHKREMRLYSHWARTSGGLHPKYCVSLAWEQFSLVLNKYQKWHKWALKELLMRPMKLSFDICNPNSGNGFPNSIIWNFSGTWCECVK